jgi:anti-sigma regulatory factor (Ser/Thr protein kinase)
MTPAAATTECFSHEALFYAGQDEFVERMAAFIREGLLDDEPVLVMVTADKIALLRAELGSEAARVTFIDMGETGRNPGRIISAWNDFAADHLAPAGHARGIGEPIWAGRSSEELAECQHHESLINLAFIHADGFRLMCPYDTDALPRDVIEEARRSHPLILDGEDLHECRDYRGLDAIRTPGGSLHPPHVASLEMGFHATNLDGVRRFAAERAGEAGLSTDRTDDFVIAVNEAATNSVLHGGGEGLARVWQEDGALVCEIRDRGRIAQPLVGRTRPGPGTSGGHGLWLAHHLCDLVQLRTRQSGTVVRMHMRVAAA